jgi:hypothetical protein
MEQVVLKLDVIGSLDVQGHFVVCIGQHSHESTYQLHEDQHHPGVLSNVIVLQQLIGKYVVPRVCLE